ncbi:MAG: bifunctional anthranilate synthase component II/anthranilate phosphoribosyltransferase [Chloroflexi bacterium]|nr:bifunctional anthranilate synthase component II/anthranilate phosphoribosyltransferase [Chloroflexota bacterium]
MIVVIDNYDSFTYNLVQHLGELGADPWVFRNDRITLGELNNMHPSHIVISPGPGTPEHDAGITNKVIRHFHGQVPILGVCLGHQCIAHVFGGQVGRAPRLMHGKVSRIIHQGGPLFAGLPTPFEATRYHSLIVQEPLPDDLQVLARTAEGEVMALRHRQGLTFGVQFHPESILTPHGKRLLKNFMALRYGPQPPPSPFSQTLGEGGRGDEGRLPLPASGEGLPPNGVIGGRGEGQPPRPDLGEGRGEGLIIDLPTAIERALANDHLSADEAEAVMARIMSGEATPAQIGAYLAALRAKGETVAEIAGFARAMRQHATPVHPTRRPLVDTCGTGGDKANTFNISTTAALVVAGAGVAVAKHGNRSVSSRCGSADVLGALGVKLDLGPEALARCIDEVGFGFLFAPMLHPAMKHAIGPRREMGVRTVFNILGPLTNPAGASVQVIGVFDRSLLLPLANVLGEIGSEAAYVVHSADGLDELSTTGPNHVASLRDGQVSCLELDPAEYGLERASLESIRGGDAAENARITREVLGGAHGPRRDVVLLNAGLALTAAKVATDLREGIARAAEAIDSGRARQALESLTRFTQGAT